MSIKDFMLFHSRKLESLRTCMDFSDFARERIYERIPPKASSLEKTAYVARMSAESLKWLIDDTHTRYNRLNRKARGERLSPFVFQSWPLYPNYWLFEVVKACILAGSYPLESKGYDSLAPDRQSNPEFNKRWPKTPGATAFWGASMSTAEAISGALLMFLKKSFLWAFPELPNYTALRPGLCEPYDKENIKRNFSETGDLLPLIPTWQNLSLGSVVEYISPAEWPPAKLDREYSRVMNLINHEATLAQTAEARLQKPAETKKEKQTNGGKKQSWEDDAVDYMLLSEAIVKFAGNKPAVSTLSKKITPNGSIRYMRRGRRCKVHIGDFREYAQKHYPSDALAAEIADEYMADVEGRKAKERKRRPKSSR